LKINFAERREGDADAATTEFPEAGMNANSLEEPT
jgi:hypothetical protein